MDFPILVVLFLCLLNFPRNSFSSNGKEMASFMIRQKNGAFDTLEPTIIGLGSLTIFVQGCARLTSSCSVDTSRWGGLFYDEKENGDYTGFVLPKSTT